MSSASGLKPSVERWLSESRWNQRSRADSHLKEAAAGDEADTIHHHSDRATFDQGSMGPPRARAAALHFHNQMFMSHFLLPFPLPFPCLFLFEQNVLKHPLSPCWGQKGPVMLV